MPDSTIPDPVTSTLQNYLALLADYKARMTPRQADRYIGKKSNTILGAIEREEIRYYTNGKGYEVTPLAIAEWLDTYCKPHEPRPLPC